MKIAICSVLCQSHPDFRLTAADDDYPDPNTNISDWFEPSHDGRVSYERSEHNLGVNANYRKSASWITQELVVMMGVGDIMRPNSLECFVRRACEHLEADIFQPVIIVIDVCGGVVYDLAVSLLRGAWIYFWALGQRAEAIEGIGLREGYDDAQDPCLTLDGVMRGGNLLFDDELVFICRRFSGSGSSARAVRESIRREATILS